MVALASAAVGAAAALLARLVSVPLHAGGLLDGLLQLHAALVACPESLACSMGKTAASEGTPTLQVHDKGIGLGYSSGGELIIYAYSKRLCMRVSSRWSAY